MRLVMMGTGPFAAPTFAALIQSSHTVAALVTQPVRGAIRGKQPPPSPLRAIAAERRIDVFDPEIINTDEARARLVSYAADLFIVADYGQILADATLGMARLGGINLHGSLLPKYRGAAPINWAIYNGDTETGVTVIQMATKVDAGACFAKASTPIDPEENAVELETRLAELGAPLVCRVVDDLANGTASCMTQDDSQVTPARRLRKTDGLIDWSRPAAAIKRQVLAMEPWPKSYTFWNRPGHEPLRLILGRCDALVVNPLETEVSCPLAGAGPGTIVHARGDQLLVVTGSGFLRLREVQPAGKRMFTATEFMNGYPVKPCDVLGGA